MTGGGGATQSLTRAAPVVALAPVHCLVKYTTALPGAAWSSAYAMSAAPLVGSIETWKKSSSVRSRAGVLRLQPKPSIQIGPVWMLWSLALNTPQVAPPSMVWAMYAFQ